MKDKTVYILDEKDLEIASRLEMLGIPKLAAQVALFLELVGQPRTHREIEVGVFNSEPSVNIALNYLKSKGWVKSTQLLPRPHKKGARTQIYVLTNSLLKIVDELSSKYQADSETQFKKLEDAKAQRGL